MKQQPTKKKVTRKVAKKVKPVPVTQAKKPAAKAKNGRGAKATGKRKPAAGRKAVAAKKARPVKPAKKAKTVAAKATAVKKPAAKRDEYLSQERIADRDGLNPGTVSRMLRHELAPKKGAAGINYRLWCEFRIVWDTEKRGELGASSLDESRKCEIDLRCEKHRIEIKRMLNELVPIDEHRLLGTELCGIFANGLEMLVQNIGTELRNPIAMKLAKQCRNDVLAILRDQIEGMV